MPDGRSLHILCNHLKSQGDGAPQASATKRKRQAERIAQILGTYNHATDLVIVAGDFNDYSSSAALQPLFGVSNLFDVLQLKFPGSAQDRWTYKYGSQLN